MKRLEKLALAFVLTFLAGCLSLLVVRTHKPSSHADPVLLVLRAQKTAKRNCSSHGQLSFFSYAKRIAQIDATACPDDFFQAWEKYVTDIQALAAIRRANAGKAVVSVGFAFITKSLTPLAGAVPENPAEAEIVQNDAVADWQNLRHVALHYGITIAHARRAGRHEG